MKAKSVLCMATALAVLLGGLSCRSGKRRDVTFHDPNMDFGVVKTVTVMPFVNMTPVTAASDRVRDMFMTMLQATGSVYVLPPGEVTRATTRLTIANPSNPTADDAIGLGKALKADAVITGSVLEYGEARSGTAAANVITVNVRMLETQTGRVVWSAAATKGGVGMGARMFGGGGEPMDVVTQKAIKDLLAKLFH